jgi:hypothetical protein
VYGASRASRNSNLFKRASNGVGSEVPLFPDVDVSLPRDWSSDGKTLVFDHFKVANLTGGDIWILDISGEKKPSAFLETPARETEPQISPDGQYIAFATNESGQYQIVVRTFPDPNKGQWTISSAGGVEPRWRRMDGGELYYLSLDGKLMVVPISSGSTFVPGAPTELFPAPPLAPQASPILRRYDVTANGQRFLFAATSSSSAPAQSQPLIAIINWTRGLKRK